MRMDTNGYQRGALATIPPREPHSLAEYLVWCERIDRRLNADQQEIAVLRTMLRERMTETRIAMTEEAHREYVALRNARG